MGEMSLNSLSPWERVRVRENHLSRSLFLSLLTYALLLVGIITLQGELIALALPLVSYLLIGYLQTPEKISFDSTRQLSLERAAPNQEVEVTVTVTNRGQNGNRDDVVQQQVVCGSQYYDGYRTRNAPSC